MLQLHGSGKTTVLVERIVTKIINEKIDIDKLLIVTFTKAAASEMKERILDALYKKITENPNDTHLQKQLILLNKANISTIHSFCLDIIKNYFYEIDISPKVRLADTAEIQILKQEILRQAVKLFAKEGCEAVTVEMIASAVGIKGVEFGWISSKPLVAASNSCAGIVSSLRQSSFGMPSFSRTASVSAVPCCLVFTAAGMEPLIMIARWNSSLHSGMDSK